MRHRGDILKAKNRHPTAGKHYIVFYEGLSTKYFLGAMITHTEKQGFNLPMAPTHFLSNDSSGKAFKITYDHTFLVQAKLMKLESWGPFTKVGQLSAEGVLFVKTSINHLHSEEWRHYLARTRT